MRKEVIKYTDYNGLERTKTCYFNLSKGELAEMEMSVNGGLAELLQKIIEEYNGPALFKHFKEFLLKAYGEKREDGDRFFKSEELSNAFYQTEAYSVLLMKLINDSSFAAEFVNAVVNISPQDIKPELKKIPEANREEVPTEQ